MPPEDAFLRDVARLESTGMATGRLREFHFALSALFRRYLDRRFGLETEPLTTAELLRTLHSIRQELGISPAPLTALKEHMEVMDLVKFARYAPSAAEQFQAVQGLKDFVETHRPAPEEPRPDSRPALSLEGEGDGGNEKGKR